MIRDDKDAQAVATFLARKGVTKVPAAAAFGADKADTSRAERVKSHKIRRGG